MALATVSCEESDSAIITDADTPNNEYIEPAVEQFKEPSDLKISLKKARNFSKASEALVIMGQEWAEKMSQVDNEEKLKMAAYYEKAQDDLIRKFGIQGKEEFKWIQTKALPESINRDIFARAGIWINR
jgi:vacuolar-type H+-ATPase subunit H